MSEPSPQGSPRHTGGCQCGAVRFAVDGDPIKIGICHCRMCQKAVAGPFAVLAEVPWPRFAWTRGTPAVFQSSTRALRDFCAACGTPLSYRHPGGPIIELLTGAFDQPDRVPPSYAVGTESMLAWLAAVAALPGKTTSVNLGPAPKEIVSFQHPDHETEPNWQPPRTGPPGR
ncbi:MAG TPA: GFA family protein [Hyphomicrobiaceae bacterium]|nr:GFA family protein [Hyphomicrobiaceae bacterium]